MAGVQAWGTPAACSARYGRRNGCQSRGRARLPPSCRGMRRAIATLLSENVLLPQGWGKQLASKIASSKECGQTFAQQKGWLRPRLVMKVCSSDPRVTGTLQCLLAHRPNTRRPPQQSRLHRRNGAFHRTDCWPAVRGRASTGLLRCSLPREHASVPTASRRHRRHDCAGTRNRRLRVPLHVSLRWQ